jgi:hypothetical protein
MRGAAILCFAAIGLAVQAQTLSPLPQPGLWEQQFQVLLNGQDVMGAVQLARGEILQRLPAEQRRQIEAMLPQGSAPGTVRQCVTAAQVAQMADPAKTLSQSLKTPARCNVQVTSVTAATVAFKGRCDDPRTFTGDYAGQYTVVDPQHWTYTLQGQGTVSPQAAAGTPAAALLEGPIELQGRGQGRWLSADCGNVRPAG